MTKKKNLHKTIVTFLGIATLGAGAGAAAIASAASAPTNSVPTTQNAGGKGMGFGRRGPPGIIGTVTAVAGERITVTDMHGTVYTALLTNAKITKNVGGTQPTTITAADINRGDTIGVRGTISGSMVTATFVMDGISLTAPVGDKRSGFGGHREPGISGKVSSVSGTTLTIAAADGTIYTVDAASATLSKLQTITTSDLVVGDEVGVMGTVSGTSVTATDIMDGQPLHGMWGDAEDAPPAP